MNLNAQHVEERIDMSDEVTLGEILELLLEIRDEMRELREDFDLKREEEGEDD